MSEQTSIPVATDLVGVKSCITHATAALYCSLEGLDRSHYTESEVIALFEGRDMPTKELGVDAYTALCENNLLTTLFANETLMRLHLQTYLLENLNSKMYALARAMDLLLSRLNADREDIRIAENLHQRAQLSHGGRRETFDVLARVMAFLPVFNQYLATRTLVEKPWFNDDYFYNNTQILEELPKIAAWYGDLITWYESTIKEVA